LGPLPSLFARNGHHHQDLDEAIVHLHVIHDRQRQTNENPTVQQGGLADSKRPLP